MPAAPRIGELNRPLFHWSPTARRRSIQRLGLVPGKAPTCSAGSLDWQDGELKPSRWRPDYVCLGPDPWRAAVYSWRVHGEPGDEWDLWQVWLDPAVDIIAWRRRETREHRHVEQTPDGPVESWYERRTLIEVRVGSRIPKSRVEWLGSRVLRDVRGRAR